jgi:hypothetical protein
LQVAGPAAAKAFKDGEADVFVLISELSAGLVQEFLRDPTVRLMNVAQAEALTRVYPFLARLVLPQGVIDFEKNIPANDVSLIAVTHAVVIRKNLHPELISLLAQAISEEHGGAGVFQRAGDFPRRPIRNFPSLRTPSISTKTALRFSTAICRFRSRTTPKESSRSWRQSS